MGTRFWLIWALFGSFWDPLGPMLASWGGLGRKRGSKAHLEHTLHDCLPQPLRTRRVRRGSGAKWTHLPSKVDVFLVPGTPGGRVRPNPSRPIPPQTPPYMGLRPLNCIRAGSALSVILNCLLYCFILYCYIFDPGPP